ncbi:tyrosine-type recombinase/integrase [Arthrobacter ramosus]|uniref:Tyrosine-type recombinase/integrase n=1 Tax=Arthrobacter ramosus TaxID=1672 RepID=A0ABV5XTT5_ARTRM|nr:tyrosine-type recombinase/integrase [Arthrobacter ramosus]
MTLLAPTLEKYFAEHLMRALGASTHTIAAYRDTWRLLLAHVHESTAISPDKIELTMLHSARITSFIKHLEHERGNSTRTRNARLAAVRSFFAYAAYQHPEHAELIARVLAIPQKRVDRSDIDWLTEDQIKALLAAPDRATRTGRRDHALILTAITTGLRVTELTGLTWEHIHLGPGAHVICQGKGRKNRATPLSPENVKTLTTLRLEQRPSEHDPVFPTRTGARMSTDAVAQRVSLHAVTAANTEPSLSGKNITPHVLRHSTAMRMLHAGIETSVIALWLGHESAETTQIYVHADLALKEKALERIRPTNTPPGRYAPGDKLLAFLEAL